jgi:hypothetical protein
MAGQLWSTNAAGGYMYADNLSKYLRVALQPMMRFRQMCEIETAAGKHRGESFNWNIYSDLSDAGGVLNESQAMPESGFTITQETGTLYERGESLAALFSNFCNNLRSVIVGFHMTVTA